jgi:predicted nucleic acid-binding protein
VSPGWVIDSSIALAWVHSAQSTRKTDELLEEVGRGGSIVVPALWFTEVANGLLVLQRRRKLTRDERRVALSALGRLQIQIDEEPPLTAFSRTSDLAERYGLSLYDAAYLEICSRRQLPLASRDEALNGAAKKAGIHLF